MEYCFFQEADVCLDSQNIVVGLGNPGRRYQSNRHNVGFMVVDELLRRFEMTIGVEVPEYQATSEDFEDSDLVLIKPQTYMNLSGEALVRWSERSAVELNGKRLVVPDEGEEEVASPINPVEGIRPLIVCDDLALPLGAVRLRGKGSSGGQNGLQSVIDHLQGDLFPRLRLGISPRDFALDPEFWPDYVLADFDKEERPAVQDMIGHAADTVEFWLKNGLDNTASRFNRKGTPQ